MGTKRGAKENSLEKLGGNVPAKGPRPFGFQRLGKVQ